MQQLLVKWHPTHIFDDVLPVLKKAGITDEQIDTLFVDNAQRIFGA
ncbi:MAG: hypothetical protein QMC95_14745 [Desulfitobacteriaceae bacterium]|nr:hypothetical protein [Desulfitobacteriaceae bacterium]